MYEAAMATNVDQLTKDILEKHYPLHAACMRGDCERVQQLLHNGFIADQEDGMRSWTPMHWAANGGQVSDITLYNLRKIVRKIEGLCSKSQIFCLLFLSRFLILVFVTKLCVWTFSLHLKANWDTFAL